MSEPDVAAVAAALTDAVNQTNSELMNWANGTANTGPYSQEAHRICVHITAALRLLECNFRAHLESQDHEQ